MKATFIPVIRNNKVCALNAAFIDSYEEYVKCVGVSYPKKEVKILVNSESVIFCGSVENLNFYLQKEVDVPNEIGTKTFIFADDVNTTL